MGKSKQLGGQVLELDEMIRKSSCKGLRWFLGLFFIIALGACTKDSKNSTETVRVSDPARGRRLFIADCTTCHNADPSRDGTTGPAIKGSSQVLLETKVLQGKYPPGYTPKRKTSSMPVYPHLRKAIPDIAAFLQ